MSSTTKPGFLALEHIEPTQRTLSSLLSLRAQRLADDVFISDTQNTWTGVEALRIVQQRAQAFAEAGVRKGDKVAIVCPNSLLFVEVFMACAWLGAVIVPINTASKGAQLQHIIENSDAKTLICVEAALENFALISLENTALQTVWMLDRTEASKLHDVPITNLPDRSDTLAPAAPVLPSDELAILYTSGTSGPSKGVICPHAQFYWWGIHTARKLELTPEDKLYTCLPLFHTNALNTIYQALVSDCQMILGERFSASRLFDRLAKSQATVTYLLGAMIPILLTQPKRDTDTQHSVRIGLGPAVPSTQQEEFKARFNIPLIDGFGSTESNFIIGGTLAEQKAGYMGVLSPGFEALVVNEYDEPAGYNEVGELILRSNDPYAFSLGYYKMPEATIESRKNLWLHTGDRVSVDENGYYKFIDRLKDMIRRRGENISSFEVESAIASHYAIESVAVYAVESDLAEEEVMASITLKPGHRVDFIDLIEHCQKDLPYFAVPRFFRVVSTMPATENGKIQKYKLRTEGVTQDTWDRETANVQLKR